MNSIFRPRKRPDPAILDDHRPLLRSLERRGLIRGGLSLGALTMLTGCDVTRPKSVEDALLAISRLNDGVQAWLFDPNKLAPTYPASMVLKPPKFNAYYDVMDVKPVSGADWHLELSGLIADKRSWTLAQINALPQRTEIIKHICVEGWDYIGQWTGVPLRTFLERVARTCTPDTSRSRRPTTTQAASTWRRRSTRRRCSRPGMQTKRWPIRSATRCGCGCRPNSATRTRNGSPQSR
jgi:hypothetical protein